MRTHLLFPPDSVHHACFFPQKDQFNEAMQDIPKEGNVILAPHLCPIPIPKDWILYNAEQIGQGIGADPQYLELLKRHEVWDYSMPNITALKELGINAKHCPLGYSPCLERIDTSARQDIDVLFYGSVNQRRHDVLMQLHKKCKVQVAFGVYNQKLFDLIARSKIILNMHYYPTAIHEITRTSFLMANKKFIVSEVGNDAELEKYYDDGIVFAKYEDIVDKTLYYLGNPRKREAIAQRGYELFRAVSQKDIISALCA